MAKISGKDQAMATRHIARRLEEKTAERKTATAKYEAPKGSGPSTLAGVDRALETLMRPAKSK